MDRRNQGWLLGLAQLVFVIAVVGLALFITSFLSNTDDTGREPAPPAFGTRAVELTVSRPQGTAHTAKFDFNGVVSTRAITSVAPQVGGQILFVSEKFQPGAAVQKGELLFEIDPADFELSLERSKSEIAAAESDLALLEAEATLALTDWNELFPDEPISDLAARRPQIAAAKARLDGARASLKTAELSLTRTRVFAPEDGTVRSAALSPGQVVAPNQVVGQINPLGATEITVSLSPTEVQLLSPLVGRQVAFDGGGKPSGVVVRVDGELDQRTRLVQVYIKPDDPKSLRIGQTVTVSVSDDPVTSTYEIPLSSRDERSSVWVVEEGQLRQVPISVIDETATSLIVEAFDYAEGIVSLPPANAEPGQPVIVRNAQRGEPS